MSSSNLQVSHCPFLPFSPPLHKISICISRRIPWLFILKLAQLLSSIALKGGGAPASDQLQIFYSYHLNSGIFKSHFKHENVYKDVVQRIKEKITTKMNFGSAFQKNTLDLSRNV